MYGNEGQIVKHTTMARLRGGRCRRVEIEGVRTRFIVCEIGSLRFSGSARSCRKRRFLSLSPSCRTVVVRGFLRTESRRN